MTTLSRIGLLLLCLSLSSCDDMRPEPIVLDNIPEQQVLVDSVNQSLIRLGYRDGQVQANLGQVGQRLELRTLQYNLELLGYYEGPRLGLLDPVTITAIEQFIASQEANLHKE